mgnify:CR=1 FL=1|jgi:hypothetical protein
MPHHGMPLKMFLVYICSAFAPQAIWRICFGYEADQKLLYYRPY